LNDKPKPKTPPAQSGTVRSSAFDSGAGSRMKRAGDWKYDIGGMAPPLERGAVVDGFLLEKRLHQGGMASMWRVSRVDADGNPAPVDGEPPL